MFVSKKPLSKLQSVGAAYRPQVVAISFLLAFGASLACFIQKAEAMGNLTDSDLGEIQAESVSGNLHCEIVTHMVSENLRLTGVIWASAPVTGRYSFMVMKQGSGGGSNVAQSGLFQVVPNEKRIVGTVMVNALSGDHYHARLSARSEEDEVICDTQLQ